MCLMQFIEAAIENTVENLQLILSVDELEKVSIKPETQFFCG